MLRRPTGRPGRPHPLRSLRRPLLVKHEAPSPAHPAARCLGVCRRSPRSVLLERMPLLLQAVACRSLPEARQGTRSSCRRWRGRRYNALGAGPFGWRAPKRALYLRHLPPPRQSHLHQLPSSCRRRRQHPNVDHSWTTFSTDVLLPIAWFSCMRYSRIAIANTGNATPPHACDVPPQPGSSPAMTPMCDRP